jgi:hypothetical protein
VVVSAKRSLFDAIDDAGFELGFDNGVTRRRSKMKTRVRERINGCNLVDVVWVSEMDLGAEAMQFGRRNHPPRAHKGSISMNQLQS